MKHIVLFSLVFAVGCASAQNNELSQPHPTVTETTYNHNLNNHSQVSFDAKVKLSGTPHRLVLSVSRQFPRRYYKEEIVDDSAEIMYVFGAVHIKASLNKEGDYPLRTYPAHIVLYHRKKDLSKQVLSQWWVTEQQTQIIRPKEMARPHLNVQSCERFIAAN